MEILRKFCVIIIIMMLFELGSAGNLHLREIEKGIEADLSVDEAYKHMTFLVEEVGERLAGTRSIEKAANYIKRELERFGLDARTDQFYMYHSYPKSAALRVVYPETRVLEAKPVCHILSTLEEGLKGELVYAGAGGYEDYENIEAEDKIILTDMTWAPLRPERARIAFEKKTKAFSLRSKYCGCVIRRLFRTICRILQKH